MSYEHDYYSDQCAGCKWAEWRGGCLNKATADDGSDLDAADRGECRHFEAGQPQKRPPQPGDRVYVHVPLAEYDSLRARAEAAEAEVARLRAELAQAWAVVESRLAEVSQHDHTMRTLWGSHSRDREVEIRTLQRVLRDVKALGGAQ